MNLIEGLECRQFLSASPVADLAEEGKVAELARTEPGAVSRVARRDSAPAATASRRREPGNNNGGGSTQGPTNPVAELATGEAGGAAVSELARSEPGAVAELARSGSGGGGENGGGENGGGENGGGENGGGENGGGGETDREPNPVAELARTEGGAAVSELARSAPGAVAALVRSASGGENGGGENGGGENGDGENGDGENGGGENGGGGDADRELNPVAELAKSEGGAAVSELARSEPGAVAEFSRSRIRPAIRR